MEKERLDVLLVERGLAESREKAKTTIMAGLVLVDGQKTDKAGTMVKKEAGLRVLGDAIPYVSRGGLKLAKAIESFDIEMKGRIVADIGASTGGFTDCKTERLGSTPSTSAMASWHGSCAVMSGSSIWSGRTFVM